MIVAEVIEGYKQVYARSSKGLVRKYRCTSGQKKGRVVAKPSTCFTAVGQKKSTNLKKTRRLNKVKQAQRRNLTTKRPTYGRVRKANRPRPRKRKK
jgi:hypothetical protein